MENVRQIKSYVFHEDKCFFVSTIERDSSSFIWDRRYNETIVWTYDWAEGVRGDMICQDEDYQGSIRTHNRICEELYKLGHIKEEEN